MVRSRKTSILRRRPDPDIGESRAACDSLHVCVRCSAPRAKAEARGEGEGSSRAVRAKELAVKGHGPRGY